VLSACSVKTWLPFQKAEYRQKIIYCGFVAGSNVCVTAFFTAERPLIMDDQ